MNGALIVTIGAKQLQAEKKNVQWNYFLYGNASQYRKNCFGKSMQFRKAYLEDRNLLK